MPTNFMGFVQVFPTPPLRVYVYQTAWRDEVRACEHCDRRAAWTGRPLHGEPDVTWPAYCADHMVDEWRGRHPAELPMREGQYAFLAPFPTFD